MFLWPLSTSAAFASFLYLHLGIKNEITHASRLWRICLLVPDHPLHQPPEPHFSIHPHHRRQLLARIQAPRQLQAAYPPSRQGAGPQKTHPPMSDKMAVLNE